MRKLEVRQFLSCAFLGVVALVFSAADSSATPRTIKITPDKIFRVTTAKGPALCANRRGFPPVKRARGTNNYNLLKDLVTAAKGRSTYARLKAQYDAARPVCARGPRLPTPTPTPFLTSTPNPTPTATQTPIPDLFETMTRSVTESDLNHLYRRAGLGLPPDAARAYIGGQVGPLVDYFMTYRPEYAVEDEAETFLDENVLPPHYPSSRPSANGMHLYALRILAKTQNQFHERLAFIGLHDRLSTSSLIITNPYHRYVFLAHLDLLRRVGSREMDYRRLIEEIGQDPTMILWLSLHGSIGSNPNENYARELMELFTLDTRASDGTPNYTDADIREVAKAFSGWTVESGGGGEGAIVNFTEANFAPGLKTLFAGTPWQGQVERSLDVVNHIFNAHPNTAPSLAKWLLREYLTESHSEAQVQEISNILRESNFNLRPAIRRILTSSLFFAPEYRSNIARSPTERFVHLMRIMDRVSMPYNFTGHRGALANLGCIVTQPESVFGCDRLEELPDGQRLMDSQNLVTTLSNDNSRFTTNLWDYSRFFPNAAPSVEELISHFESLFGVSLTAQQRSSIVFFLNNNRNTNGTFASAPWNPGDANVVRTKVSGLFRIFAALPQFHDLK